MQVELRVGICICKVVGCAIDGKSLIAREPTTGNARNSIGPR